MLIPSYAPFAIMPEIRDVHDDLRNPASVIVVP
jgi:hypothetical protein